MKNNKDFTKSIMERIRVEKIRIRPRYQFIIATVLIAVGILGTIISSAYFFGLSIFAFRAKGPLSNIGLLRAVGGIPWWSLLIAVLGLGVGYWLWKKSETTYKITPMIIIITMLAITFTAGIIINSLGWGDSWFRRGPIKRFYIPPTIEKYVDKQRHGKIIRFKKVGNPFWLKL